MQYPHSFKRNDILIRTLCNLLGEIYREVSFALPGIWTIIVLPAEDVVVVLLSLFMLRISNLVKLMA